MSLADRRTAALTRLAGKQPPAQQRYPGETQPSGDMPDNPWQAEAYLAARDCADDTNLPAWPEALRQDGAAS